MIHVADLNPSRTYPKSGTLDMDSRSPSKHKVSTLGLVADNRRVFKICAILILFVVLVFGAYHAYQLLIFHDGASLYFTVVVDCGSTGTRVSVYEWMRVGGGRELPRLVHSYPEDDSTREDGGCGYHCMQTEPGLDKFVGNGSGVRAMLEPLILLAEKWVPRERHKVTPIFVLGTAGLRRLETEDARRVLDDVEGVIRECSFMYRKSWVRVLSGKEEAYYGWAALNYKLGSLGESEVSEGSSGVLDLGGSSLQIVLEVDDITEDEHLVRSKIGMLEHRILAYSLSEFGLNEAFDRSVFLLRKTQSSREKIDGKNALRHPCFGSDFVQNYTCRRCHMLNDLHGEKLRDRITPSTNYPSLKLVGVPDWEQCKALGRAIALNFSTLELSEGKVGRNCEARFSSNGGSEVLNFTALAQHSRHFHALSGFSVVYNVLNLTSTANITTIWGRGKQLCSSSWTGLSRIPGNGKYAEQRCFQVPYIASLIEDAFCLGNAEMVFGPGDVSWTLGAALVEGQYSWPRTSGVQTKLPTLNNMGSISSPLLLFVLLLGLLFVVYRCQIKLPMPSRKGGTLGTPLPSFIQTKHRPN